MNPSKNKHTPQAPVPDGVRYGRWAGRALGLFLIAMATRDLLSGPEGAFAAFKVAYYIIYGLILNLPFTQLSETRWKCAYAGLVFLSALFVFIMIASVMFAYMAAADRGRGERLGVPGFEGSLIFFALLQVPVVLFERKPDLLD